MGRRRLFRRDTNRPVYIWTGQGYTSAPINTHPDDYYVRQPIAPTFDHAWQGVQKQNAVSVLAAASVWAGMPPLGSSGGDIYQPYGNNPMQNIGPQNPVLVKSQPSGGRIGPMTPGYGNPTNPSSSFSTPAQPGLLRSIIGRLLG